MWSAEVSGRLRAAFEAADYSYDGVLAAIGEEAHRALGRNSTLPAVRALNGRDDALAVLTLLWPLQRAVARTHLERALPGLVEPLLEAEVLRTDGDESRALIDVRPYAADDEPIWVVADLTPNLDGVVRPIRPDFVLGVSSASATLAQLTIRRPVGSALDLGTGCGVQSVHLARHTDHIVATDLNPRALRLARATLSLNQTAADLRLGSLYEPVAGERFDLVISNPPYVMSPPVRDRDRLVYREGDREADQLVEHLVRHAPDVLADGGTLQLLANWAHVDGQDWTERLAGWIEPTGCDGHVVQREVLDVAAYAELWLADAGLAGAPDYFERYGAWLDYFARLNITGVGMGWIVLHQAGRDEPRVRIEDWPYDLERPIGPALEAERLAVELDERLDDPDVLALPWRLATDVVAETLGRPGAADPEHVVYRQQRGFRRAVELDTALAAVLGACDGELPVSRLIEAVAELLDRGPGELTAELLPSIRRLAVDGILESPVGGSRVGSDQQSGSHTG
jgi:methylase of polypeptide subunit release factors